MPSACMNEGYVLGTLKVQLMWEWLLIPDYRWETFHNDQSYAQTSRKTGNYFNLKFTAVVGRIDCLVVIT
jgi:hypothetical protein